MNSIRNIYCVGRNYALHARELGNEIPKEPLIFSKPTHALALADGRKIHLPSEFGEIHYEVELVIYIGHTYRPGMNVDQLITKMGIGLDLTLRDLQSELKQKGKPWLLSKGFPNSAIISKWMNFPGESALRKNNFSLLKNGVCVQRGNVQEMIFDLQTIVDFCASRLGIGKGDVIFTGTPSGVRKLETGDELKLLWGEQELGSITVVLE